MRNKTSSPVIHGAVAACSLFAVSILALLLLSSVSWASVSGGASAVRVHKQFVPTTNFDTTADFNFIAFLQNASNGGAPIILTPGYNPADLNQTLLTCAGNFTLNATAKGTWLNTTFSGNSPYPGAPCQCPYVSSNPPPLCPPYQTWPSSTLNNPIIWNTPTIMSCGAFNRELMDCMRISQRIDNTSGIWAAVDTSGVQLTTDYRIIGGQSYPGMWGRGAMVCNGTFNISISDGSTTTSTSYRASPGATSTLNLPSSGNYTISTSLRANECYGAIHKWNEWPGEINSCSQKYFALANAAGNAIPATTSGGNFNVVVANPTSCAAEFVNATPNRLEDLGSFPLPYNTTYEVSITVRNIQSDVYIQAESIELAPGAPYQWGVAEGNMPNGFHEPIAPLANKVLRINLTTPPNGTISGPVPIIIHFNSSTPLCNGANCTANLSLTLFNGTQDLVGLIVAPTDAAVGIPFTVEAITYNNGSSPTPRDTNTSVNLDGGMQYYPVPAGLNVTYLDANGLPVPPYVSRIYPFVCTFPHMATIIVDADWDVRLPEDSNRANNHAIAIINCGRSLICPDYT